MKATLIVEGKEFSVEIQDPELQKLLKPPKKTGYERVEKGNNYFYTYNDASVVSIEDSGDALSYIDYDSADYYSDQDVAENNARAEKLMRQLRRFAVEQREYELYWARGCCNEKWSIIYDCPNCRLVVKKHWDEKEAFAIYFDTEEAANLAIETFRDELIWYFTEYKDSL